MTEDNKPEEEKGSSPLNKALENLEKAEAHLADTRADESKAEHEVEEAISEIKEAEEKQDYVEVRVIHVNEVEKTSFEERLLATLQEVWNKAYDKLHIEKKPKDIFQTAGQHPKSLMTHLSLTLAKARQECVIDDFCFGIASETGGACSGDK